MVSWDGYYINLDRSPDRRERIKSQLRSVGIEGFYRRFEAVDGKLLDRQTPLRPGEVGIFRSHLDLLRRIASSGRVAHVLEDDAVLCDLTVPAIEHVLRSTGGRFDILFTDMLVPYWSLADYYPMLIVALRDGPITNVKQLAPLDLATRYMGCTGSYVVTPTGAARAAAVLQRAWDEGPTAPVDLVLRPALRNGILHGNCIFPFVTTADLPTSSDTLSGRDGEELHVVHQLIRYVFFVRSDIDRDARGILKRLQAALPPSGRDDALEFLSELQRFMLFAAAARGRNAAEAVPRTA